MQIPSRLRSQATRWGPLFVAVLFGSTLFASALRSYWAAQSASEPVTLHQGMSAFHKIQIDASADEGVLHDTLPTALSSGATYLALWEGDHRLAEAGKSAFPGLPPTPLQLQTARDRARMCFPGLPNGQPDRIDSGVARTHLPAGRVLVIEFEPSTATAFVQNALSNLLLSTFVAVLLTSAAAVLWHLGRRAERMRAELARAEHLAQLGGMSAVLAHEIRNPLASLKGNAQLLAENPQDGRAPARIARVVRDAIRLEKLTNDLLQFARSGTVQTAPSSPTQVLESAALAVDADRVDIVASGAPDLWPLDSGRIEQVLVNLLDNALRVTPGERHIIAEVASTGAELAYSVRDHGPGVPPSDRARIFDPFHTTSVRGVGLGLAVARRIVELHGGRIEVDDAPDGGAVFRVLLPAALPI
jgi:two-component system sensor histidine kinase HydH